MTEKDSSAIALHLQAQSFEGMNELLPAAGCYYNIQEKYPADYLAAAKLGAINIAASYYDEAIEATEKYRKIDTTNIAVNRQNALAYCLKQDYPTAIRRYQYLVNQGDSTFHTCSISVSVIMPLKDIMKHMIFWKLPGNMIRRM